MVDDFAHHPSPQPLSLKRERGWGEGHITIVATPFLRDRTTTCYSTVRSRSASAALE